MPTAAFEESANYVQSLARGLQVLRAFDRELPNPSLSQVADRIGLPRAAVRRSLLTLQHLGYVGSRGRSFFLTPRVLELGFSYLSSLDLSEMAQQCLEQLSHRVGESCSMAVLDGSDIVYVVRVPVRRIVSVALGVGARLPAFVASMGRVMLADLPDAELTSWIAAQKFRAFTPYTLHTASALRAELKRVRTQGYAMVSRELEPGLCSVAVPVRSGEGRVIAAVNIGMPYSDDAQQKVLQDMLPALQDARRAIEQTIQHGGGLPHLAIRKAYA